MPWYNPLSWSDGYHVKLAKEIKEMGDEAYDAVYGIPEVRELPPEVQRTLMRVVRGEVSIEAYHKAVQQADVDRRVADQCMSESERLLARLLDI